MLKILKKIGRAALSGIAGGVQSGAAASAHKGITRGNSTFSNAGAGLAATHENMFPRRSLDSRPTQIRMQELQNENSIRLQQMSDRTQLQLQLMKLKHETLMTSLEKGHEGLGEIPKFFTGKAKDEVIKEYGRLKKGFDLDKLPVPEWLEKWMWWK